MIQYKQLDAYEIDRELFGGFIRRQKVTKCWREENGTWTVKDISFVDDWTEEDYEELIVHLRKISASGGFVLGAFREGQLKGFVSLGAERLGEKGEYIDLIDIYVSEDMRRKGIGKGLFLAAGEWARKAGAEKLYISAHSAVESQAFYRAMGCVDAAFRDKEHVRKEPCDRQLERAL